MNFSTYFRRRECESISIPISTPVTRNEGIIVPITRIDGGSTGSNSSSSNTALNRPIVRNVPIQIVPAISSQVQAHTHAQAQWPNFPPPTAPSTLGKFPLDATDDARCEVFFSNHSEFALGKISA